MRTWTPPIKAIADELIEEDPRNADDVIRSWRLIADEHGEKFRDDDWLALVLELARRAGDYATANTEGTHQ
jgi:hypothetical protein